MVWITTPRRYHDGAGARAAVDRGARLWESARMRRVLLALLLAGCVTSPRYVIQRQDLPCDRAVRLAYRTLETMGYTVTKMELPGESRAGFLTGTKTEADGAVSRGSVRIRCSGAGVEVQPIEGGAFSDFAFSRGFLYSFKGLVQRPDVETPIAQAGVQVLVERLDATKQQLDLGGTALAGDDTLVRITVRNATDRALLLRADDVQLARPDGTTAGPLAPTTAATRLAPGEGGERVRRELLTRLEVGPGATLVRFAVYPPAPAPRWREAQVSVTDVETDESDGFFVPVQ
jgi:hypothetical protein